MNMREHGGTLIRLTSDQAVGGSSPSRRARAKNNGALGKRCRASEGRRTREGLALATAHPPPCIEPSRRAKAKNNGVLCKRRLTSRARRIRIRARSDDSDDSTKIVGIA